MKVIIPLLMLVGSAYAAETTIVGNVQSKCIIHTDVSGVYGNPTADKLSTNSVDGGVQPIIRYDVSIPSAYIAKVTTPTSFSSSPSLSDNVVWVGSTSVSSVSNAAMSDYDTNKVIYNSTTEFDLHTAGTTWFKVSSAASYGYGKAFPGGEYRAVVEAECIAK